MMLRGSWSLPAAAVSCAALMAASAFAQRGNAPATGPAPRLSASHAAVQARTSAPAPGEVAAMAPDEIVQGYCVRCHNDELRRGELSLETFTVDQAVARATIAETAAT